MKVVGRKDVRSDSMIVNMFAVKGLMKIDRISRQDQIHNANLLKQMAFLCQTVPRSGRPEICRRQEDNKKMEAAMTTKMGEGFRNEQQTREQENEEMIYGLENEENARADEHVWSLMLARVRQGPWSFFFLKKNKKTCGKGL